MPMQGMIHTWCYPLRQALLLDKFVRTAEPIACPTLGAPPAGCLRNYLLHFPADLDRARADLRLTRLKTTFFLRFETCTLQ